MDYAIDINKNKFIKLLSIAFCFCVLFVFYLGVTLRIPYNSDHAIILLEAKSIMDGNLILRGWTLSTVSYYTTEIPFYILGIILFGFSEKVIYIVTSLNYALLTLVMSYLCAVHDDGKLYPGQAVISICLALFIPPLMLKWGLLSPVHIVGFTYCLLSIFLIKKIDPSMKAIGYFALGLVLLIAFIGDSFTIYVWGLPIVIVFGMKFLTEISRSNVTKSVLTKWEHLSPAYIVGFAFCLWPIYYLLRINRPIGVIGLVAWGVFPFIALVGDRLPRFAWKKAAASPLGITARTEIGRSSYIPYLVTVLIALALAKGILYYISLKGGLLIPGVVDELTFVDYPRIGSNLYLFIIGLFDLFSVNFFGQPIYSFQTIVNSLHLIGLLLFMIVLFWNVKNFTKLSMIKQILTVGVVINLCEYLLGNVAGDRTNVRYLMPALFYAIILMTSFICDDRPIKVHPNYLFAVCLLIGLTLVPKMSYSMPASPVANLTAFLEDHHLENGYGPYWMAAIARVHTQDAVTISAVTCTSGEKIKPYHWLSDGNWYGKKANFLVVEGVNYANITTETAVETFGPPANTYPLGDYTVLVWNKDITPNLQ